MFLFFILTPFPSPGSNSSTVCILCLKNKHTKKCWTLFFLVLKVQSCSLTVHQAAAMTFISWAGHLSALWQWRLNKKSKIKKGFEAWNQQKKKKNSWKLQGDSHRNRQDRKNLYLVANWKPETEKYSCGAKTNFLLQFLTLSIFFCFCTLFLFFLLSVKKKKKQTNKKNTSPGSLRWTQSCSPHRCLFIPLIVVALSALLIIILFHGQSCI